MPRPLWSALLLCLLVAPGPLWAEAPNWLPVSGADLADNEPHLEPVAAAEIISLHVKLETANASGSLRTHTLTTQVRIKIYDPGRANNVTRTARFWAGPTNRDYKLVARLTLPDGTVRLFDESDVRERKVAEEGHGAGLFSMMRGDSGNHISERFLAVPGIVRGAVLDMWEWEPNIPHQEWIMNTVQTADTPIREFAFTDEFHGTAYVSPHDFVLNPHGAQSTQDKQKGLFLLTAHNLPSLHAEPLGPPVTYTSLTIIHDEESIDKRLVPNHMIARPPAVPEAAGPWAYYATERDFYDADMAYVSSRMRKKAAELTAGAATDDEKARRLYRFVQSLYQRFRNRADLENWYTRYVESEDELIDLDKIDSTIIRPMDFHYLFMALARAAGLECHSVFHADRNAFRFRPEMLSSHFLEYASVEVNLGEKIVLCDPCSDVPLAFGALPWQFEGYPALVALPLKQVFLNVPPLAADQSVTDTQVTLELDPAGQLKGECVRTLTGHGAHDVRVILHTYGQEEWPHLARALFGLQHSPGEVQLTGVEGLEDPESPVRLKGTVRWPAYALLLPGRMVFPLSVWHTGEPPLLHETARLTPVFFAFPKTDTETLRVHLPAGWVPSGVPKPITAQSGTFSYGLTAAFDAASGVLEIHRSFTNTANEIAVADYPKARDWLERVGVADQIGLMLKQTAPDRALSTFPVTPLARQ